MGYALVEIIEAMHDARVVRALHSAIRDRRIVRRYRCRGEWRVDEVVAELAAEYHLSEERVRAIVYRKRA